MMTSKRPSFIDSEYYKDGKLLKGAPEEVKREYEEFMAGDEEESVEIPVLTKEQLKLKP